MEASMRFDLGPDLATARAAALDEVDRRAAARAAALGGDTAAHRLKRAEAERAVEEGGGVGLLYPVLAAEAAATHQTIQEVARVVLERAEAWSLSLAKIEAERVASKARIRAAPSHRELRRILGDAPGGSLP
jgi:hypothetical protein